MGGSYYERSYTPVSKRTHTGTFDLVVKVYPTGRVSPVLGALAVGDSIMVRMLPPWAARDLKSTESGLQ